MNTILILLVVLLGANFLVEPNIEKNITYCPMKEMQETPKSINIPYDDFVPSVLPLQSNPQRLYFQ